MCGRQLVKVVRPRRRIGAAVIALLISPGFALGACGGDAAHKSITRASFIRTADARCMSASGAAVSVDMSDLAKTSVMLRNTIAVRIQLEKDLKSIAAPAEDGAALRAFFDSYARHLVALNNLQAAAAQGNAELATRLASTQSQRMKEMEDQASAYGFSFCGRF